MIEAKGVNGQITFDGQFVTIHRKGALARTTVGKGEKRIPVRSITAVQWKPAGLVRGYIQFTVPGGNESRSRAGRQTVDAAKDENSVLFGRSQTAEFQAVRAAVEQAIANQYAPAQSGPPAGWVTDTADAGLLRWWDGTRLTEHTRPA